MTNIVCPIEIGGALKVFKNFIKSKGLKWTQQREAIVKAFLSTDNHVTVDDMIARLRSQGVECGQATIYRNMKLLTGCGIAEAKHFEDGYVRYDQAYGHGHHEHIICIQCRKIVEFQNQALEDMKAQIANDHGFQMLYHHLEIFGVCDTCQSLVSK